MTIIYTGQLAAIVGVSEDSTDLAVDTTLVQLVESLIDKHGDAFANLLRNDTGNLRSTLLVILDGTQATGDRASLSLDKVNELMFMTPIAGG